MLAIYARHPNRKRTFARKLGRKLDLPVLGPDDPMHPDYVLFNWGCSQPPASPVPPKWLGNTPGDIRELSNKLRSFRAMMRADIPTLDWTMSKADAQEWLADGALVYERHRLKGHSGEGITIRSIDGDFEVDDAPLYTKGLAGKWKEYRVHVGWGRILCVQQKRKMGAESIEKRGWEVPDDATRRAIRTYRNGWVFCVNKVDPLTEHAEEVCLDAVAAHAPRDGGDPMYALPPMTAAVDIAVMENDDVFVIELNSAPALRSKTVLDAWANALLTEYLRYNIPQEEIA